MDEFKKDLDQFAMEEDWPDQIASVCAKSARVEDTGSMLYITKFPDLTVSMRKQLIDWLLSIHHELNCAFIETFHCTVYYIDTYMKLTTRAVAIQKFQLVGVAALCISIKMTDTIVFPGFTAMAELCGGAYTAFEVRQMVALFLYTIKTTKK
jgi:hypothetical protein